MGRVSTVTLALGMGIVALAPAAAQSPTTSFTELYGQLEQEREQGVICAGLMKGYGSPRDQLAGRMAYSAARGAFNATIESLTAAFITGEEASVEATFAEGVGHREKLCDEAMAVLPDMAGTKNPLLALLGPGVVGDVAKLVDSVREFRTTLVEEDAVERNAVVSRLEAKKWPAYDDISAQR